MGSFASKHDASTPTPPTTEGGARHGVGAEQDRYGSHFGMGDKAANRIKEGVKEFARQPGSGAEQDRYESHFGLDHDPVQAAVQALVKAKTSGAEQDRWGSHFGLGADGWARAKKLAETQGAGAEQVC